MHTDTKSFAAALREAARMDPDVVLVGEMRDLITTGLTLTLAEMGSLVFATVHTNSTAKTIDRIINVFPQDERDKSRIILSEVLRGIISQQILRKKDGCRRGGHGNNDLHLGPAQLIRSGKTSALVSLVETGKTAGMQLMDESLEKLVKTGVIDGKVAYMRALDKKRFESYVGGG